MDARPVAERWLEIKGQIAVLEDEQKALGAQLMEAMKAGEVLQVSDTRGVERVRKVNLAPDERVLEEAQARGIDITETKVSISTTKLRAAMTLHPELKALVKEKIVEYIQEKKLG